MEFKAEEVNGKVEVKPIVKRDGPNLTIQLPALSTIAKLTQDYGKRNI